MAIGTINGISSSDNDFELILSSNFITLDSNESTTITVDTPSDGKIYAVSRDVNIATVSVSDKTITINAINYGSTIITIGQAAGTGNYASITPSVKDIFAVNSPVISATLNSNSWSTISYVSQQGTGANYWSVGDTKEVVLNGNIGDACSLNNFTTNVFILHFNYPMNKVADNNIIWGGFKANDGKDIALVDSYYSQFMVMVNPTVIAFSMAHWAEARYYGWKGCDLRYDILGATSTPPDGYGSVKPTVSSGYKDEYTVGYNATSATLTNPKENTLLAALPSEFRNNLRLFSRWIDPLYQYVDEDVNVNIEIEETIDAVTLLAITEVSGTRYAQNVYEPNAQVKMEYYANGNTTKRYKHNDTSTSPIWLLANNDSGSPDGYDSTGAPYPQAAHISLGIAPAFKT